MCAQVCTDDMEQGIALLSVAAAGLQSHSHCCLLLKVVLRSLFSSILTLCLVLVVVKNSVQNHVDQHLHQEEQFGKDHGNELRTLNSYGDSGDNKNPITGAHLKGDEFSYLHQNIEHFSHHLGKSIDFHSSIDHTIKRHHSVDGVVAPGTVGVLSSQTHISASNLAVSTRLSKKARSKLQRASSGKMNSFVKILQDLLLEGLLKLHYKILCLDAHADKEVVALKRRGFENVEGISLSPLLLNSEDAQRSTLKENLADQNFDFLFSRMFDCVPSPALFVAEIERSMKLGGFAAMHVSLDVWRNKFISSEHGHGMKPVTLLFKHSEIVYVSTAYAPGLDTIIVFKKVTHVRGSETGRKQLQDDALTLQPTVEPVEPSENHMYRKWAEVRQWKSLHYIPKLWDIGRLLHAKVDGMPLWSATRPTHDEVVVKKSVPINSEALPVKSLNWLNKAMVQDDFSATKMHAEALFDGIG
eukprot:c22689_g1_i1 orf=363-1772(-)